MMEWKPGCGNCGGEVFEPYPKYVKENQDCYDYHVPLNQLPTVPNQSMEVIKCCKCGIVYKVIFPKLERMITHIKINMKIDM